MNVTSSGCPADRKPGHTQMQAPPQSEFIAWARQLRLGLAASLTAGIFAMLAGTASPARADQGMEWEPGGILYKYLDRYDPRHKSHRRARASARRRQHEADDDDEGYSSVHDDDDNETTSHRRTTARHRASRRTSHHRRAARRHRQSHTRRTSHRKRIRVASLGGGFAVPDGETRPRRSVSGGAGVAWVASASCLNSRLKAAIYHVARNFGHVRVNSTCRSRRHNRRVGGARHSWHLSGNAADIRIWGNVRAAAHYLRSVAGGYKHYGGGLFHIDTGPRRTW